ncbi:hypothetical protein BH23CHL4_BH23CHL4_29910 [soil metagenome]
MTSSTTNHPQDPYQGRRQHILLGYAALGAILAWFGHLNLMYFLVQPVCRLGGNWTFHVASVVFLGIALGSGFVAWRFRSQEPKSDELPRELDARSTVLSFLGAFGIAASALMSLAIITQWAPVFVIGPCT